MSTAAGESTVTAGAAPWTGIGSRHKTASIAASFFNKTTPFCFLFDCIEKIFALFLKNTAKNCFMFDFRPFIVI
jgi:hypothetical protein